MSTVTAQAKPLTVDQLAARVGMTVRNVRAYAARGLLPPPRLVGRTGFYGPQHVSRLQLVRDLLAQGYTLGAVQKAVESEGATTAGSVALSKALLAPWLPEAPQETDVAEIAERAGVEDVDATAVVVAELTAMGVLEDLGGGRLRVLDPGLLDAGVRGVRLGLSAAALVTAQRRVVELVTEAAEVYVAMFRDTVWADYVAAGSPPEGFARIQEVVEGLPPVAAAALLSSFRTAMAAAVSAEIERALG